MSEWVSVDEYAERAGVHPNTVRTRLGEGRLSGRFVGGDWQVEKPPKVSAPRPMRCGMYFIQCGDFIKIGHSADIWSRYTALQRANPHELTVIGVIRTYSADDARELESLWHERFSDIRHIREWFHMDTALLDAIRSEAEPWPFNRRKRGGA